MRQEAYVLPDDLQRKALKIADIIGETGQAATGLVYAIELTAQLLLSMEDKESVEVKIFNPKYIRKNNEAKN